MTAGAEHRWTRVLFNAGEPTNSLSMWGIEGPDGSVHAVGCRLSGRLNDGPVRCAILPNDDGTFAWFNGDEEGTATSFGAAWAEMLVLVGDDPQRIRSEAALAKLCGACPIPASSGKTSRHRLNRGGHRWANAALHRVVVVRMRAPPAHRRLRPPPHG